jgi:hypothetical protein
MSKRSPPSTPAIATWRDRVVSVAHLRWFVPGLALVLLMAQGLLSRHAIEHTAGHPPSSVHAQHTTALAALFGTCDHSDHEAGGAETFHGHHPATLDHAGGVASADNLPWGHEEGSAQCAWLDVQLTGQATCPTSQGWVPVRPPALLVAWTTASPDLAPIARPYEARGPPLA